MLSQLLRQQKGPCSCSLFTQHMGSWVSAWRATGWAGGGTSWALSVTEKSLCPRSALCPAPPPALESSQAAWEHVHLLNHIMQGGMEKPALASSQGVSPLHPISPFSAGFHLQLVHTGHLCPGTGDAAAGGSSRLDSFHPNLRAPGNHGESKKCLKLAFLGAQRKPLAGTSHLNNHLLNFTELSPACRVWRMSGEAGAQHA